MIDKRVAEYEDTPGVYYKFDGKWYGVTPNGMLAGLAKHQVFEHADGTITVSPSILVTGHDDNWHGYLEKGVWRSV